MRNLKQEIQMKAFTRTKPSIQDAEFSNKGKLAFGLETGFPPKN